MAGAQPTVRHYDTILAPVITEKATILSEQNKVVFRVADNASSLPNKTSTNGTSERFTERAPSSPPCFFQSGAR